jgi:hypothetical protein
MDYWPFLFWHDAWHFSNWLYNWNIELEVLVPSPNISQTWHTAAAYKNISPAAVDTFM